MNLLCDLARKYGTDKGGNHLIAGDTCHNYTKIYDALLSDRRENVRRVLEIGVLYGQSLRMWEEYFPHASIFGVDSNADCQRYDSVRTRVFLADQSSEDSLHQMVDAIWAKYGPGFFDLIVDDGSHVEAHQILTAKTLLPYLKPDGLYVIEDLDFDCQPQRYGDQLDLNRYKWVAYPCGQGLGKAHCHPNCPACHGAEGEFLLVVQHV